MLVNSLKTADMKVLLLSFALKYLSAAELKNCHQNIRVKKKTVLRAIIQDFVMELSQQTRERENQQVILIHFHSQ